MVKLRRTALLAGVASMVLVPLALAQSLTDAEFKCQAKTNKAGSKFVGKKAKCASKCMQNFWKGANPDTDCLAPYGGATSQCIDDTVLDKKGVEDKFRDAILKSCDPGTKSSADCPECYSGGDCSASGEAGDRVQNIEGQVDSFGPGVFCQGFGSSPTPPTKEELNCEVNTAKTLSKLVGSINKCYDKCNGNAFKGLISQATCVPPASDPVAVTCLDKAKTKAISGVDKKCSVLGAVALPDCDESNGTPDEYPDGAFWVNTVSVVIEGNVPDTYCGSPSAAFLD
jgi:hypothetical protein